MISENDQEILDKYIEESPDIIDSKVINLKQENEKLTAQIYDRKLRLVITFIITLLFIVLNAVILWYVYNAICFDNISLGKGLYKPQDRVITEKVYISLIAGVVVETSSIFLIITRYLFPNKVAS